jgi:hypothetical protein
VNKSAFEQGVEFAYRFGKVNANHLRAYAINALDRDLFIAGYLTVIAA